MRARDLTHLAELLRSAESGTLTRSDAVALFLLTRAEAPASSMLRDIGHSIAHDSRDRGYAFEYVREFVEHVVDVLRNGGALKVPVAFEIGTILDQLHATAAKVGAQSDASALHAQRPQFVDLLGDILDGTSIELPGREVSAIFEFAGSFQPAIVLQFNTAITNLLPIHAGTKIAFPMLEQRLD